MLANGQEINVISKCLLVQAPPREETKIIMRCYATNISPDPLLVIDGYVNEINSLQNFNPDDIESITILKNAVASAIYGYRAANGVILITTKSSGLRKFIIKDLLEGKTIPGATVKFKSLKDRNDSLVLAANDSGFILTNKLKAGVEYEIEVSSVGFKNYNSQFKNPTGFHEQTVFLERRNNNLKEVVVVSYPPCVCRRSYCCCAGTTIKTTYLYSNLKDSIVNSNNLKVYPNPLPRGSNINIELTSNISETSSIRVFSLAGALMHQQKISTSKWKTISIASDKRWTAGTYIVQLLNDSGKPVGQQKIIVQ